LAEYFEEERRCGRVARDTDAKASAALLLGVCFYRSLMRHLFAEDPIGLSDEQFLTAVAKIVARGVQKA
jgi:hypothetical protein